MTGSNSVRKVRPVVALRLSFDQDTFTNVILDVSKCSLTLLTIPMCLCKFKMTFKLRELFMLTLNKVEDI